MAFNSFSLAASVLSILTLAGTANASLFSFASDDDSSQFTFRGTAGTGSTFGIVNGRDPAGTPVTLKIDDNNGAQATVSLNVGFRSNFTATFANSVGVAGAMTYVYTVTGTFSFVDLASGAALLTGSIGANNPAAMTVLGSNTSWGSSGAIFDSDSAYNFAGAVVWTATQGLVTAITAAGANAANYGIAAGSSNTPDDFGFTLTNLNSNGGPVPISSPGRLPTSAWASEGSFSGSAINGIPSPGALTLVGIAGLLSMSRRRR